MKQKVKYFIPILVLGILSIISLILSTIFFVGALEFIKSGKAGGIVGGLLALAMFVILIVLSSVFSLINLPITIKSTKASENKIFPTIMLVIEIIIIIIAAILVILLITHK